MTDAKDDTIHNLVQLLTNASRDNATLRSELTHTSSCLDRARAELKLAKDQLAAQSQTAVLERHTPNYYKTLLQFAFQCKSNFIDVVNYLRDNPLNENNKATRIKRVRDITSLGLKGAKDLTEAFDELESDAPLYH